MPAQVVVLGGGVGGTLVANLLDKSLGRDAHVDGGRPDRDARTTSRATCTSRSARRTGVGSLATSARCCAGTSTWSSTGRSGSIPTPAPCSSNAAGASSGTTSSSRPALGWCPSRSPGSSRVRTSFYSLEGAQRLREELRRFRGGRILVGIARHPLQVPAGAGRVRVHAGGVPAQARAPRPQQHHAAVAAEPSVHDRVGVARSSSRSCDERGIELTTFFNVEAVDPAAAR